MKKFTFSKKLAAYSALAVAGVSVSNAQIVYHDVNPDADFATGDSLSLDIDNNAAADYYIKHYYALNTLTSGTVGTSWNRQLFMAPLVSGNVQMGSDGWNPTWNWYGEALNLNDSINATGNWVCPGGVDSKSRVFFATAFNYDVTYGGNPYAGGGTYGNFKDATDHYMGIKFQIGANFHYGWVRVNVAADASTMTLKDWAYNSVADQPILAGQMTVGVAENDMNVGIFAADRKLNINTDVNGSLNVFSTVGQNVVSQQITENTVIDMSGFSAGIYTVQFESNGNLVTKKVSL